jgi:hypothetical protein
MHSLDHILEQPESDAQAEKARAEAPTNLALDQGKPQCNPPQSLTFILNHYLFAMLDCALSL